MFALMEDDNIPLIKNMIKRNKWLKYVVKQVFNQECSAHFYVILSNLFFKLE